MSVVCLSMSFGSNLILPQESNQWNRTLVIPCQGTEDKESRNLRVPEMETVHAMKNSRVISGDFVYSCLSSTSGAIVSFNDDILQMQQYPLCYAVVFW